MKYFFFLFSLFNFSFSYSQNLNLEEIISLRRKQNQNVKDLLVDKNWELMHNHYSDKYKFGDIRFAFDNKNPDRQIPVYLTFYHNSNKISKNRIEFVLLNKEKFDLYFTELKTLDFKYVNSKFDINYTSEVYKNDSTTIEVKIMPVENYFGKQQTFYSFMIIDNNYEKTEYKF